MPDETQGTSVMTPGVQTPSEFNFDKSESWSIWLKRFDRYVSVTKLGTRSEREKIDLLLYTMGEKAKEILAQVMPESSSATLKAVMDKFSEYFAPKKNIILSVINLTRGSNRWVKVWIHLLRRYIR